MSAGERGVLGQRKETMWIAIIIRLALRNNNNNNNNRALATGLVKIILMEDSSNHHHNNHTTACDDTQSTMATDDPVPFDRNTPSPSTVVLLIGVAPPIDRIATIRSEGVTQDTHLTIATNTLLLRPVTKLRRPPPDLHREGQVWFWVERHPFMCPSDLRVVLLIMNGNNKSSAARRLRSFEDDPMKARGRRTTTAMVRRKIVLKRFCFLYAHRRHPLKTKGATSPRKRACR
jgi:hypothetical protein